MMTWWCTGVVVYGVVYGGSGVWVAAYGEWCDSTSHYTLIVCCENGRSFTGGVREGILRPCVKRVSVRLWEC